MANNCHSISNSTVILSLEAEDISYLHSVSCARKCSEDRCMSTAVGCQLTAKLLRTSFTMLTQWFYQYNYSIYSLYDEYSNLVISIAYSYIVFMSQPTVAGWFIYKLDQPACFCIDVLRFQLSICRSTGNIHAIQTGLKVLLDY